MRTFNALMKQEYLINKRSLSNLAMGIGMPTAFFLLFTTIWASDPSMSAQRLGLFVRQYLMQMAAFSSLSFAFYSLPFAFQEDRAGNRFKTIQHSPVPIWQYYVSKILGVLVQFFLAILVVFLVGAFAKGVSMPSIDWVASFGLIFFGAVCFMPFGLLLSNIQSTQTLSVLGNILYMGTAVLGGLWMPVETFPDFMQQIAKFMPTYHLNNMLITYFKGDFAYTSVLILLGYAMIITVLAHIVKKRLEVK